jgi:hypothetical protein
VDDTEFIRDFVEGLGQLRPLRDFPSEGEGRCVEEPPNSAPAPVVPRVVIGGEDMGDGLQRLPRYTFSGL